MCAMQHVEQTKMFKWWWERDEGRARDKEKMIDDTN